MPSLPLGGDVVALVVGPGAVGRVIGARLERLGIVPRFVGRSGSQAVNFELTDGDGTRLHRWPAPSNHELERVEVTFVAVKAFDLERALAAATMTVRRGPIISVANGAVDGIAARAAARAPKRPWRLGVCTFGASVVGPDRLALRSVAGGVHFGPLTPCQEPTALESKLVAADPDFFAWHADIMPHVRRKWLYNTVLNSLTAARGMQKNGDVLADVPMLAAVFEEAETLAQQIWGPWATDRQSLYEGLLRLVAATADNENSMARDVRLGRPTESDHLAGRARDPGAFPLLTALHAQITGRR